MDMLPVDRTRAETLVLGGDRLIVLASSDQTDDAMFAIEITMPAGGGPPVMHRHAPSELYYVLDGEFTFYLEDADGTVERIVARAGDAVPLPSNQPHAIRNESDTDATALSVHTPGRQMEAFARAGAALAAHGSPSIEEVLELARDHGVEMLGPIPEPRG